MKTKPDVFIESVNWTSVVLIIALFTMSILGDPDILDGISSVLKSFAASIGK